MTITTQEIYKKNPENTHEYHQLSGELDDSIADIEMHLSVLSAAQKTRLHHLVVVAEGKPAFDASEVDKQYHLLLRIQEQVVDMGGNLKATASIRDISSVINSMGSLVSLFLKAENQLDSIKAEADLKQAVLEAIKAIPPKAQRLFFDKLEELEKSGT
ncbi:hypothetical protein KAU11_12020 [Candidatus Babeliales bacterium]|nr:hypothetical protein [Candidatus Babeliales bacterium]